MFEDLKEYRRIVVTGPQRSGTTIAGRMIAHDTGHRYVDEAEFGVYDTAAWRSVLGGDDIVVQCPHMLKVIVDDPPPDVFVVLMRRRHPDIKASERRISWQPTYNGNSRELAAFGLTEGDSALVKYAYWDAAPKPPRFLEVEYESLGAHPLYVAAGQRVRFGRKQTAVEG